MKNIKLWEPWYFENSKLPIWLSKIAPIDVWAFSAAFWVCCRGEMSDRTRRHEAIHYQQQLEMDDFEDALGRRKFWGWTKYKI